MGEYGVPGMDEYTEYLGRASTVLVLGQKKVVISLKLTLESTTELSLEMVSEVDQASEQ